MDAASYIRRLETENAAIKAKLDKYVSQKSLRYKIYYEKNKERLSISRKQIRDKKNVNTKWENLIQKITNYTSYCYKTYDNMCFVVDLPS